MLSLICFGSISTGANYFYYFSFFSFVGISFFSMLQRRKLGRGVFLPTQTIWYILFTLFATISGFWADSLAISLAPVRKMVQILVVTYCLDIYVDDERRMRRYMRTVIAASVFMIFYVFVFTPPSQWFAGFLGEVTHLNTNDIGLACSVCVLLSFYFAYIRRQNLYYLVTVLSFFLGILTSSRKSLLMSAFGIIFIVVFNYRARKYFLRVLIILSIAMLALVMIYEIPELYNTVGTRMDTMVKHYMTDRSSDYSITLREYYISMAKEFFRERPLLGIGLNNFSYRTMLLGDAFSYAHNNYWEIAADLGIVGLIFYYWFYIYLLVKHLRRMVDGSKISLLFSVLMLLFLIFEYSMVTYYKMQIQIVIAASWSALNLRESASAGRGNAA